MPDEANRAGGFCGIRRTPGLPCAGDPLPLLWRSASARAEQKNEVFQYLRMWIAAPGAASREHPVVSPEGPTIGALRVDQGRGPVARLCGGDARGACPRRWTLCA